jgi:hypothetical protein
VRVKVGEAAVCTAGHSHAVPEPCCPQQLIDHVRRAAELVARIFIQVGRLAHVVHLPQRTPSAADLPPPACGALLFSHLPGHPYTHSRRHVLSATVVIHPDARLCIRRQSEVVCQPGGSQSSGATERQTRQSRAARGMSHLRGHRQRFVDARQRGRPVCHRARRCRQRGQERGHVRRGRR